MELGGVSHNAQKYYEHRLSGSAEQCTSKHDLRLSCQFLVETRQRMSYKNVAVYF